MKKIYSAFLAITFFYGLIALSSPIAFADRGESDYEEDRSFGSSESATVSSGVDREDSDEGELRETARTERDEESEGNEIDEIESEVERNENGNYKEDEEREDRDSEENEIENELEDDDDHIVTPPATSTSLMISSLAASGTGTTTERITWDTNRAADSKVYLSAVSPVVIGGLSTTFMSSSNLVSRHILNLGNLAPGATYHFIVVSTDVSGKTATSSQSSFTVATSTPSVTPTYTLAQIATHNTQSNCWTAVGTSVYNLTQFIASHPGGVGTISTLCGINGTSLFNAQHGSNAAALAALTPFKIGNLVP